jgi:PAS domain S-box-containing protein
MVWTALPDGLVDYVNERWYQFTGFNHDVPNSREWYRVVHPDDRNRSLEIWQESLRNGNPYDMEFRFWDRRESCWRWFVGRAISVRDDHGKIIKWFGSCTDIDEQKRVQDDLRRANQDLEQFAFSASHDLQEPLRSVSIYSELLGRRYGSHLNGEALQFINYMQVGAKRMEMLVRDLLAYTRLTRFEKREATADANVALEHTLETLAGVIAESGAQIQADSLPETVPVHEAHLQLLFQNLIGNALKYRSVECIPTVHITAEYQTSQWLFSVIDNGIGIDPAYKEKIFGLFKRLHTNDKYPGTGLGLAICQRIVDRYHGRIWVDSEPGKGSAFRFTIPV